jgi:hypothetical protein
MDEIPWLRWLTRFEDLLDDLGTPDVLLIHDRVPPVLNLEVSWSNILRRFRQRRCDELVISLPSAFFMLGCSD